MRFLFLFLCLTVVPVEASEMQLVLRQASVDPSTHPVTWKPQQTAAIVCDMWDLHHCLNATLRGGEMAPRMNRVLNESRLRGATIIHAPSSCMEPYKNHPGRKRAQAAPAAKNLPTDISKWCYSIPSEEQGEYPIDQTD